MQRRSRAAIDSEVGVLNAQIALLKRREDDVCRILEDTTRLRDSVRADKQALLDQTQALEAQKWPINWLPNELLTLIFIAYSESADLEFDGHRSYHRPPVVLSHVCKKWRKVCLMTSCLWSHIFHGGNQFSRTPLLTFIERSNSNPLDFVFESPRDVSRGQRNTDDIASHVLTVLYPYISRIRSIMFQCHGALAMREMVDIINAPTSDLSNLRSLTLTIMDNNPSFKQVPSLIELHNARRSGLSEYTHSSPSGSLQHLRLEQVPLFNVPRCLLSSVLSVDLCFPPKHIAPIESRKRYILRMSDLRQFLALMPQLRDLVLWDTIPFFDIKRLPQTNVGVAAISINEPREALQATHSIELPELRSIEWSYPYPADVYKFLGFLFAPSLERLDLFLDDLSSKRSDIALYRGYDEAEDFKAYRHDPSIENVIQLDSLKELSLQCVDDDAITHVFRHLAFPILEKVEIANVGSHRRKASLPPTVFPRLESIFRDPRLPHLTHLILSHFQLDPEHVRSMLGYMPALISLSLDTCSGVGMLLENLAETSTLVDRVTNGRLPVKFCSRLESISLLACDGEADGLRRAVKVRNVGTDLNVLAGSLTHISPGGKVNPIRPMKKLRRRLGDPGTRHSVSGGATSIVIPIEAGFNPARIASIRIEDCGSIAEEEALSLRELGVDDVLWNNTK